MQKFWWNIQNSSQISISPKVKVIKFGDGYEQRVQDGINNNLRSFSVTLIGLRDELTWALKFLNEHGGVRSFLWREPSEYDDIKVVCRTWTSSPNRGAMTINATFEEVVS
ncbi:phage tail protein [Orbus mooreae]|uniref:phage tail protein n=1 Tax=Orbus mooreae TaxID=3074107 RepID=UPI00370D87D1